MEEQDVRERLWAFGTVIVFLFQSVRAIVLSSFSTVLSVSHWRCILDASHLYILVLVFSRIRNGYCSNLSSLIVVAHLLGIT